MLSAGSAAKKRERQLMALQILRAPWIAAAAARRFASASREGTLSQLQRIEGAAFTCNSYGPY
jgi:hypothetical protein